MVSLCVLSPWMLCHGLVYGSSGLLRNGAFFTCDYYPTPVVYAPNPLTRVMRRPQPNQSFGAELLQYRHAKYVPVPPLSPCAV